MVYSLREERKRRWHAIERERLGSTRLREGMRATCLECPQYRFMSSHGVEENSLESNLPSPHHTHLIQNFSAR